MGHDTEVSDTRRSRGSGDYTHLGITFGGLGMFFGLFGALSANNPYVGIASAVAIPVAPILGYKIGKCLDRKYPQPE